MPNRHEMQSLADRAQNNLADYFDESFVSGAAGIASQPAIFTNFVRLQYYWTSTADAADASAAWTVYSCDFGVYDMPRSATGYTLAVR
jgi:enamine deaminase RidA (YjgF/YER057c/UK114 family)